MKGVNCVSPTHYSIHRGGSVMLGLMRNGATSRSCVDVVQPPPCGVETGDTPKVSVPVKGNAHFSRFGGRAPLSGSTWTKSAAGVACIRAGAATRMRKSAHTWRLPIRFLWLAIVVVCARTGANAQSTDVFEVASIKPRTGERAAGGPTSPDRFVRGDTTLRDLIRFAFNVQDFQIEGGPAWIASSRFEVNAKAPSAPSGPDGMRALVRRLLEDRFTLRTHVESREMATYDLLVSRGDGRLGEKLRRSTVDCEAIVASGTATADDLARCDLRFRPKMVDGGGRPSIQSMTLIVQGVRLARLATLLQNEVERIVTDKTGLDGTFDLELEFAPQGRRPVGLPGPPSPPSDGPPLATALQEQLGLKLESVRGPVPVIIIERAELPTPD